MSLPGAEISGLSPPDGLGPLEENGDNSSVSVVAPTEIKFGWFPGSTVVPQEGPELPMANTGMIPALRHADIWLLNQPDPKGWYQEAETMCGLGCAVIINWAQVVNADSVVKP